MKFSSWVATAAAALGASWLAACDVALQDIKPGITSAAEVRARMGEPGFLHANSDGTSTWEYSRQPMGVHCYMITMGRNQLVEKFEQVLTEANYASAKDGMSQQDIRRRFGAPGSKVIFDNLGEEIWEWHIEGVMPSEEVYFMVHFDLRSGGVKKTSKRTESKG